MIGPIPIRRLRWMARKLDQMVCEIERHYPGAMVEMANGRSDPMSETMRNIATADAEIEGWIVARTQGLRRDPWIYAARPSQSDEGEKT